MSFLFFSSPLSHYYFYNHSDVVYYRLLKKYGPEITWTRIMMDQNNYGPFFGGFFLYGPIFLVRHMCGVFLYLSRILTTACVGRKLGMGLRAHIYAEMPRQRAVPKARNGSENGQVQKKKKPNTDGPEITWTRTMMDQNNYGLFGIFFFYGPIFLVHNFSKDGILNIIFSLSLSLFLF